MIEIIFPHFHVASRDGKYIIGQKVTDFSKYFQTFFLSFDKMRVLFVWTVF